MPPRGPLDVLPLWGVFGATLALILVAVEAGLVLGSRKRRQSETAQKAPVGEIVAAMLVLLALLVGFTFSLAASRFDARRVLVLEEANALGTTWLRAGLLQEPSRTQIRTILREYVEVRLDAVQSGKVQEGIARSEALHSQLWAEAVSVGMKESASIMAGLFITSLNEVIDVHSRRVMAGLQTRLPAAIWAVLYLVAVLAIGAIGYHVGLVGAGRSLAILPLVVTFSAVLLLIADLDRPQEGLFKVSQQSLGDLRNLMNSRAP